MSTKACGMGNREMGEPGNEDTGDMGTGGCRGNGRKGEREERGDLGKGLWRDGRTEKRRFYILFNS